METITLKSHRTDEKVELLNEFKAKRVILSKFYDLHGQYIDEGTETFENVEVKIQRRSYKEFGRFWKWLEVFIDGNMLDDEIVSIKGNTNLLELKGCVGVG